MIAIKDMKMPKSCAECKLCEYNEHIGYYCVANNGGKFTMTREEMKEKRLDDCPLVEIITCNGCKHWNKDSSPRVPDNKEYHFCPMMDCNTAEDFFCAEAKRRE